MENEQLDETALLKQQLEELKKQLADLTSPVEIKQPIKKKRGRPKNENQVPRAEYMRQYMKQYNLDNKDKQKQRNNTYYYKKNSDMPVEYLTKYKHLASLIYKTRLMVLKIKTECPEFLSDVII
jgi:hypothetical protein